MSWARLDDRFHDHPKVIAAGPEAVGVFVMCLTWAHQARRTSPHPGVIPEAVVARFVSPRRARTVSAKLKIVGLFDELTEHGWPIHDFDDYLPKYDPEQAKAAGRRGGKARAAKQTASEPLDGLPEDRQADGKQTSSTRASARRNPVPVPEEHTGLRPVADISDPNAGQLMSLWLETLTRRPAGSVIAQLGKHVKALLADKFTQQEILDGLNAMQAKGLNPSVLPSLVSSAVVQSKVRPLRNPEEITSPGTGWAR